MIGERVNNYEVRSVLGEGASGNGELAHRPPKLAQHRSARTSFERFGESATVNQQLAHSRLAVYPARLADVGDRSAEAVEGERCAPLSGGKEVCGKRECSRVPADDSLAMESVRADHRCNVAHSALDFGG